jgi:hypothetical protein
LAPYLCIHLAQHPPPPSFSSCFSLLLRGTTPWCGRQAFLAMMCQVRDVVSQSQAWYACIYRLSGRESHSVPPQVNPKRLAFAICSTTCISEWLHKQPQSAEVQAFRSCGALLADTHIVEDKECRPMNVLFHLSPLAHQRRSRHPGLYASSGGPVHVVTRR